MALVRDISPALEAKLAGVFHPVLLVHVDWPTGPLYAHTGTGSIDFNGQTWIGVGGLGQVSLPEETLSDVADEASVMLSGPVEEVIAQLDDDPKFRDAEIYLGVTTTSGGNDLIDATTYFSGYGKRFRYVDAPDGDFDRQHSAELIIGSGPSARSEAQILHSYEDQLGQFPGDTLFRHLIHMSKRAANPDQW